jgi:anaerobic selenocysteine-containing dehydrogenase
MADVKSFCRTCMNYCAVVVETDGKRVLSLRGDDENPVFHGYSCNKGRAQPLLYDHPDRLVRPVRRTGTTRVELTADRAVAEIGRRLRTILDEHGPRSIAVYQGTYGYLDNPANFAMIAAFMRAIGSPMHFSAATIDQAGKLTAPALHGSWMAPGYGSHTPEVALLIGKNPLVSHLSWCASPGDHVKDLAEREATLIVIDPRRTETARRATIHLQARPGTDVLLLAAMIKIIVAEDRHDRAFLTEHVSGVEALTAVAASVDLDVVAAAADVAVEDIIRAARLFADAERGYAAAGTGANMTGDATLVEYLILCLQTICGFWSREGAPVFNATTLSPTSGTGAKAQAAPPRPEFGTGERSRMRGLGSIGEMPTATAAEEILLDGPGQVQALLSLGGNPVAAWPDQLRTVEALRKIELLVQTDIVMSATAKLAHYVVAMKMPYEQSGTTFINDYLASHGADIGMRASYAQYTPAVIDPPPEVLDHPTLIYKLAQAMGVQLEIYPGVGAPTADYAPWIPDMEQDLDVEVLIDFIHAGSRIGLEEIKRHPGGSLFPAPQQVVGPKDAGWTGRLDVGNADMMADLSAVLIREQDGVGYPFRLISRRMPHVINSPNATLPANRPRHNPAYMHPDDLQVLGLTAGSSVQIRSSRAQVTAIVASDPTVRRGIVSMSHAWGDAPGADGDVIPGAPTSRLIDVHARFDRHSGQPQMSNIPVAVSPS